MKISLAIIIAVNLASAANAATKIVTTNKDGKITTTISREMSRVDHVRTLRTPAPPNACDTPTRSAFEIVTGRDAGKCVGIVTR